MTAPTENSYGRILRSSALLGGSSIISAGLGALRTKILAEYLGPALFGVMGLYTSIAVMMQSMASLGLGQSAVRDIAASVESEDQLRVARTVVAYRRAVLFTGLAGFVLTIALAHPASLITFGNNEHVWAIAALSVVVFFGEIQSGQTAVLQGLRRIRDISALTIIGAVLSTALAIPILLLFSERGIVPFLIAVAFGQTLACWWYARTVKVEKVKMTWVETFHLSRSMLRLGMTFVISGIAISVSLFAIRSIISRFEGEAAVGLYTSAFTLSGIYVSFILQAMGGDYFPRLVGVQDDKLKRNFLVNEQTTIALLIAVPGLIAALVFSDFLIHLLYSSKFSDASNILRWQVLGLLGRIYSWPMAFILLARGDVRAFLVSELVFAALHVLLVWLGVGLFGVEGAGIAFMTLYLFYGAAVYVIVCFRHEYVPSPSIRKIMGWASLAVAMAFATTFLPGLWWKMGAGSVVLMVAGWVCLEALAALAPLSRPSKLWFRFRNCLPFAVTKTNRR